MFQFSCCLKKSAVIEPPCMAECAPKIKEFVVYALHDFETEMPEELPFKFGNLLMVTEESRGKEWLMARNPNTKQEGLIPHNYVTSDQTAADILGAYYNIERMEAERKLLMPGVESGSFIVRPRKDEPNEYALSVLTKMEDKVDVKHFKIRYNKSQHFFYISIAKCFPSLQQLISYYKTIALDGITVLGEPRPRIVEPPWHFKDCFLDRSLLKMDKKLGQGNFGEVYLAYIKSVPVAVKSCLKSMDNQDFMREASTMHTLSHPRLVRFLGICCEPADEPILIITEYMANGSLKGYLQSEIGSKLEYMELIFIIDQVCKGMQYLEEVEFVHRDLRATNVLVHADGMVKVADFGLTRNAAADGKVSVDEITFPVRWTAPEAMKLNQKITTKADVWSFGVLMFEILTYGSQPYADLATTEVMKAVLQGCRLSNPTSLGFMCSTPIFNLMSSCWNEDPNSRPSFTVCSFNIEKCIKSANGFYTQDWNSREED